VLQGKSLSGGGVQMTSSKVTLTGSNPPATYTGTVRSLRDGVMVVVVSSGSNATMTLTTDLQIDDSAGTAKGTVAAVEGATR